MFNLFGAKRNASVEIVKGPTRLVHRMGQIIKSHQAELDALADEHPEIDLRLVALIDNVLEPMIGPSGFGEHAWFQSLDWYGDGVRHLEFLPNRFPMAAIPALQSLLINEYAKFCILCWAPVDEEREAVEGVVIFAQHLLVTSKLARSAALA